MKSKFSKLLLKMGVITTVSAVAVVGGGWWFIQNQVNNPSVPDGLSDYSFNVGAGETVAQVLDRLNKAGFVDNLGSITWYLKLHPELGSQIQAGEYTLRPGLSAIQILETLRGGKFEQVLTFIEGWRHEQYIAYLKSELGEPFARQFDELAIDAEGRLFPDTYFIDAQTTPVELLDKMEANFSLKISQITDGKQETISQEELILASIIEREVATQADRAVVAGILKKRADEGWRLDADATTQYALANRFLADKGRWESILDGSFNWWPKVITQADLDVDSPYNTRKVLGWPPSPICNPGTASLEAAIKPVSSEYYYYLSDQEGVVRYAATDDEHNENIRRFGLLQ